MPTINVFKSDCDYAMNADYYNRQIEIGMSDTFIRACEAGNIALVAELISPYSYRNNFEVDCHYSFLCLLGMRADFDITDEYYKDTPYIEIEMSKEDKHELNNARYEDTKGKIIYNVIQGIKLAKALAATRYPDEECELCGLNLQYSTIYPLCEYCHWNND